MEDAISRKPYIVSREFNKSRKHVYEYSLYTFGFFQAERYMQKIRNYWTHFPSSIPHIPNVAIFQLKTVCTEISSLMRT